MNYKTLKDDLTFKYVFSHEDILKDFIDSFLDFMGLNYKMIFNDSKIQNYMLPNNMEVKGFFGDIVVTLNNGSIISLEMYKGTFTKREYKKSLSYLHKLSIEQMKPGEKNYEKIKKVIGISFMQGNFRRINKEIVNSYSFREEITEKVIDEGDIELYLVRYDLVPKRRTKKEKRFIKWLRMINAKDIEELEKIGKGDKIMENSIRVVKEWTKESSKNGLENYIHKIEFESEERGAKIATKKRNMEIAKNLLALNIPISDIIKATGLSKKQISNLI